MTSVGRRLLGLMARDSVESCYLGCPSLVIGRCDGVLANPLPQASEKNAEETVGVVGWLRTLWMELTDGFEVGVFGSGRSRALALL